MFVHSSQFQCEEMRKDVAALARRTPTGTAFMRLITYGSHAVTSKTETADVLLPQAVLQRPEQKLFPTVGGRGALMNGFELIRRFRRSCETTRSLRGDWFLTATMSKRSPSETPGTSCMKRARLAVSVVWIRWVHRSARTAPQNGRGFGAADGSRRCLQSGGCVHRVDFAQ
jgi:hypothetical protein